MPMSLLSKFEQRLGRFAVPHLTLGLIICQVVVWAFAISQRQPDMSDEVTERLLLIPNEVMNGEVWRLVTFVALPPTMNLVFALFAWYMFYLMGTALEQHWGTFRYNVFLLVGYLATLGASFLTPDQPASATFWQGSVFLAFAYLYPDFVIYIFFILPVKIKWLALLTWIGYGYVLLVAPWHTRLIVLASVCNFLLFFGKDILQRMGAGRRHMASQAARFATEGRRPEFYHRCTICGITDRSHPQMDFRYCSKCPDGFCYCAEHLRNHEHLPPKAAALDTR
jgi:hypothetical protein